MRWLRSLWDWLQTDDGVGIDTSRDVESPTSDTVDSFLTEVSRREERRDAIRVTSKRLEEEAKVDRDVRLWRKMQDWW